IQDARLDLRVGEIGPDGLRIKIELCAAELLVPIATAWDIDFLQVRLTPAREIEGQRMLVLCALAAGLVKFCQKRAHIRRGFHHLVGCGKIGPATETEYRSNLL